MVDVDDGGDNGHSCGSLVDAVVDWDVDLADSAAMLTQREASTPRPLPRCTCLPPRQHCAEVALGASTTDSAAMLTQREASTPRPSPQSPCLPPRQQYVEVALGGKQVHLD